jgi:hypothetical protein
MYPLIIPLLFFAGLIQAQTHQVVLGLDYLNTTQSTAVHQSASLGDPAQFKQLNGARIRVAYGSPKYAPGLSLEVSYQHLLMNATGSRQFFLFHPDFTASTKIWFSELSLKYRPFNHYWVTPYVQLGIGNGIYKYQYTESDQTLGYVAAEGRYFKETWYFPEGGAVFQMPAGHQIQVGFRTSFKTAFGTLPHLSLGYAYAYSWD